MSGNEVDAADLKAREEGQIQLVVLYYFTTKFSVLDKVLNSWYWNLYRQRLQAYFGSDPALVEKNEGDVASLLALMCESPKRKQIGAAWNAEVKDFSGDSSSMLEAYTDEVFGDGCLDKFQEPKTEEKFE